MNASRRIRVGLSLHLHLQDEDLDTRRQFQSVKILHHQTLRFCWTIRSLRLTVVRVHLVIEIFPEYMVHEPGSGVLELFSYNPQAFIVLARCRPADNILATTQHQLTHDKLYTHQ